MLRSGVADIEEDLGKGGDGQLWPDLWWIGDDLWNGLEDGGSGWDDVVSGDGGIPVAAILDNVRTNLKV